MLWFIRLSPYLWLYLSTHANWIVYIHGVVRWNHQLLQIHRNVNAFENWPLCVFCSLCSGRINKLTFSHPNISFHKPPPHPSSLPPLHCMLISPVNVMRVSTWKDTKTMAIVDEILFLGRCHKWLSPLLSSTNTNNIYNRIFDYFHLNCWG